MPVDMRNIISIIFICLLYFSCNKKSTGSNDNTSPVIAITSPVDNQVYSAGDLIPIRATITDEQFIAEIHVHVSNNSTGALLMDVHRYPNGSSMALDEFIIAAAATEYKIQVIARDRGVNEAISTVFVSCN